MDPVVQRERSGRVAAQRAQGRLERSRRADCGGRGAVAPLLYGARFQELRTRSGGAGANGVQLGSLFSHGVPGDRVPDEGLRGSDQQHGRGRGHVSRAQEDGVAVRDAQCLQAIHRRRPVVQDARAGAREERAGAAGRHAGGGLHRAHAAGDPARRGEGALPGPRHVRAAMPQSRERGALPQRPRAAAAGRCDGAGRGGAGGGRDVPQADRGGAE